MSLSIRARQGLIAGHSTALAESIEEPNGILRAVNLPNNTTVHEVFINIAEAFSGGTLDLLLIDSVNNSVLQTIASDIPADSITSLKFKSLFLSPRPCYIGLKFSQLSFTGQAELYVNYFVKGRADYFHNGVIIAKDFNLVPLVSGDNTLLLSGNGTQLLVKVSLV